MGGSRDGRNALIWNQMEEQDEDVIYEQHTGRPPIRETAASLRSAMIETGPSGTPSKTFFS